MIEIRRNPDGTWGADVPLPKPQRVVKRPVVAEARQMLDEFLVFGVDHAELGAMRGKAGDWLLTGAAGEMYPCDAGVFDKTYYLVDDSGDASDA